MLYAGLLFIIICDWGRFDSRRYMSFTLYSVDGGGGKKKGGQSDSTTYMQYLHDAVLVLNNARILPTPSETCVVNDLMFVVQLFTPGSKFVNKLVP
jgi:hypothetical protein